MTSRSTGSRGSNVSTGSLRRNGSYRSNNQISGSVRVQDSGTPLRAAKIDPVPEDRSQTPRVGAGRGNPSTLPSAPGNEDVKIRDFQTEKQDGKPEQQKQESSADAEQKKTDPPLKVLIVEVRL